MKYALVTVYQPEETVVQNIRDLARQVDQVFICDNSAACNEALFPRGQAPDNFRYVWFGENLGLSCAFNRILKNDNLSWQEDDYVLFMDQDSHIQPGHVDALISQFETARGAGLPVGCLGPAYFNTSSGTVEIPKIKKQLTDHVFGVSGIITSSMLSTYGNLRQVGFWNEAVFLDLADWDLCWRMMAAGMLCCLTDAVVLHHSVGQGEKKLGPIKLRVGAPFREYYQIRDCLYLLGERYTPLKYRIRFLAMIFIRSPLHVLFLGNAEERLHYIRMGIRDFRQKKTGPLHQ